MVSLFLKIKCPDGKTIEWGDPIRVSFPAVPRVGEAVWLSVAHKPIPRGDGKGENSGKQVEFYVTGVTHVLDGGDYSIFVDLLSSGVENPEIWLPDLEQWWSAL